MGGWIDGSTPLGWPCLPNAHVGPIHHPHHTPHHREYLLAATQDARAFVVHMAGLVYALRNQHRMALHRRHLLALEALQLYVPVASALGLGPRLREMEELSYRALFPDSYDRFFAWHRDFADLGQLALLRVRLCVCVCVCVYVYVCVWDMRGGGL
jgi:hypothetical protein